MPCAKAKGGNEYSKQEANSSDNGSSRLVFPYRKFDSLVGFAPFLQ
jgi:hypothetical protein